MDPQEEHDLQMLLDELFGQDDVPYLKLVWSNPTDDPDEE